MANRFIPLFSAQLQENASVCVKYFYSEFPAPLENITGSKETNTNFSQTAIFLAVGFAVALIFAISFAIGIYKIRAITLRKRRKELMRLPSIPKSKDSPYEMKFTNPESPYSDPDYEIIEEQDEGYEHLPGPRENTLTPTVEAGLYIDPDNKDGTYLDVVHSEKEPNDYINVSPYIDLIDDTIDDALKSEAVDILQSENTAAINLPEKMEVEKKIESNINELKEDFSTMSVNRF
ncbi:uncharacterized protein LOC134257875 isoform X2 [Saccostrea cucullata]|uniref:uncharacterized protein LOC134257875 isoform X2 n=1 Tax=Saccostrea cuccullata TaxID=36930 RepID=UPI002ED1E6A7